MLVGPRGPSNRHQNQSKARYFNYNGLGHIARVYMSGSKNISLRIHPWAEKKNKPLTPRTIPELLKKGQKRAVGEVGYNSRGWIKEGKGEKKGQTESGWDSKARPTGNRL